MGTRRQPALPASLWFCLSTVSYLRRLSILHQGPVLGVKTRGCSTFEEELVVGLEQLLPQII